MLQVKRFTQYAYAPCGVVYNARDSHIPIMWDSAEQDVLNQFDVWRKTVEKDSIVSVTGPLQEILEPGCGVASITVMHEEAEGK
jgi:hypothetical protein